MDSKMVFEVLADFGALGIASGAIFWLYLKLTQRLDRLTDSFQAQLREQVQEHNDREASIRDRFDGVVRKYDEERLSWTGRLEAIEKEITDLEGVLKEAVRDCRGK